jgi:hypothetical protein
MALDPSEALDKTSEQDMNKEHEAEQAVTGV